MSEENTWKPFWSAISSKLERELPGEGLWSQSLPIENGDVGEGLAIRREGALSGKSWYLLVYFRLVPLAVDPAGEMLGGERADDWEVEIGYVTDHDRLADAKDEARDILAGLPTPEHLEDRGYDFFLNLLREQEDR